MSLPRGRPRKPGALRSGLYVRLPERVHDDVIARANACRLSPPEWLRRTLFSALYKSGSAHSTPQ